MHTSSPQLVPTPEFVEQLINAERGCMVDWLHAMMQLPGNPLGGAVQSFGHATALVCQHIPAQVFNRVIGMTVDDIAHIPAILEFYASHHAPAMFDLNPYAIPPFWVTPNVPPVLAQNGFYQGAVHQLLYAVPTLTTPEPPEQITIAPVTQEKTQIFSDIYEHVWGDGTAIRVLVNQPTFHCYLAYVDGVPAALGILHIANGIGSMTNALTTPAFRGRGCQTALLHHRIRVAAQAGCHLLVSQCMPGVTSQNNQLRAGFQIAGSKSWWIPVLEAQ